METPRKSVMKLIACKEITAKDKSYVIRPRTLFRSPLSHIHSEEFQIRDHKLMEITTHCNYGLNYDTIKCYASLLDRLTQAHQISGSQRGYQPKCDLFRLNDGVPLQFGGFSPCLNKQLLDISPNDDFSNGNSLFQYFVEICCNMASYDSQPLLQFVRGIYTPGDLNTIVRAIKKQIESFFQHSMDIIRDRNTQLGIEEENLGIGPEPKVKEPGENPYEVLFANLTIRDKQLKKDSQPYSSQDSLSKSEVTQNSQSFTIGKRAYIDQMEIEQQLSKAAYDHNRALVRIKQKSQIFNGDASHCDRGQQESISSVEPDGANHERRKKDKRKKIKRKDRKDRKRDKKNKKHKYKHKKSRNK